MPEYPASLPGLLYNQQELRLKTSGHNMVTQRGTVRRRIRTNTRTWLGSGIIRLNNDQRAVFEDFYRFEISNGAAWFQVDWFDNIGITGDSHRIQITRLQISSTGFNTEYQLSFTLKGLIEISTVNVIWPLSSTVTVGPEVPTAHTFVNFFVDGVFYNTNTIQLATVPNAAFGIDERLSFSAVITPVVLPSYGAHAINIINP